MTVSRPPPRAQSAPPVCPLSAHSPVPPLCHAGELHPAALLLLLLLLLGQLQRQPLAQLQLLLDVEAAAHRRVVLAEADRRLGGVLSRRRVLNLRHNSLQLL